MSNNKIRLRGMKKKKGNADVDITSLLDILVILLVFLIQSYNTSGVVVNIPEGITLPTSASLSPNEPGVILQVSADKIWVDDTLVLDQTTTPKPQNVYDHGGRRIVPLFNKLASMRETALQIEKAAPNAKKFQGIINLVIDQNIKYSTMKQLMYTSAEAGYLKFKFVVMGEEQ